MGEPRARLGPVPQTHDLWKRKLRSSRSPNPPIAMGGPHTRTVPQGQDAWDRDRWTGAPVPAWAGGPPHRPSWTLQRMGGRDILSPRPLGIWLPSAILQSCSGPEFQRRTYGKYAYGACVTSTHQGHACMHEQGARTRAPASIPQSVCGERPPTLRPGIKDPFVKNQNAKEAPTRRPTRSAQMIDVAYS